MGPTILIVGSTGNTGRSVLRTLPELLLDRPAIRDYRILGLTRSASSDNAKELAKIPNVEMLEKDWTTIDADWLREHHVVRVFIAGHNGKTAFADESLLLTEMLDAGVQYVVRISTTPQNIGPASPIFYGRSHWAIENLLSQPEYKALQWTSLQPTTWTQAALGTAAQWVGEYRETGKKVPFKTFISEDTPCALLDPGDVGIIAAHLLAEEDATRHNGARYKINGPEDITGKQLVEIVERLTETRIENASFQNLDWLADLEKSGYMAKNALKSFALAPKKLWSGACSVANMPTSQEVMDLAPPKSTPKQVFESMVNS